MESKVKTENVETGPRLEDEHYLLVVECGNWCIILGRPMHRCVSEFKLMQKTDKRNMALS